VADLHVIFGTGPAGTWTARSLAEAGRSVRAVNRSGKRPELMPESVEVVAVADASDPAQAAAAADGASVVYQCMNPPYHQWPELFPGLQRGAIEAAKRAGARYVSLENLYMYGKVDGAMSETTPVAPTARKGRVRAAMAEELLDMQRKGELEVAQARASDYYGPLVTDSAMGSRTFEPLLAGKRAEVTGSADVVHSYAYIEDVGRGLATLGTHDEAFGEVWILPHAPARTPREMLVPAFKAADLEPKYSAVGPLTIRLAGLFMPGARETVEMMYEFTRPFEVDSSKFERQFGMSATPPREAMRRTVEWYKTRASNS